MKKIRILNLVLSVMLVLSMLVPQVTMAEENILFADPVNEEYAKLLDKLGIYSFYGDTGLFFEDTKAVKRYEAAKVLSTLIGYDKDGLPGSVSHLFIDVPDYYEHVGVINCVVSYGLMNGTGQGVFNPEGEIKVGQFLKPLVIALGYNYMALYEGGYPDGYVKVARELKLLTDIDCSVNDTLTRAILIKLIYNALDVDVSVQEAIGDKYSEYSSTEGVTLLEFYHDIYDGEAVVNSNSVLSLNDSFKPSDKAVLIGDTKFEITDTGIFGSVGCMVKYYYKEESGKKTLIHFTVSEENEVYEFTPRDVIKASAKQVSFEDEKGKVKTLNISASADMFLNGVLLTSGISDKMQSFTDKLTLVNNDGDREIDAVFIENYTYDIVDFVNTDKEVVYLENGSISYGDADFVSVVNADGVPVDIETLAKSAIVGVGTPQNSDVLCVTVVGGAGPLKISAISGDEIIADDGSVYYIHPALSDDMKRLVKPGEEIAAAITKSGDIVWADRMTAAVRIGYLIQTGTLSNGFESETSLKLLTQDGEIAYFDIEDKLTINDERIDEEDVKAYLIKTKANLNTTADGETSQLVYYTLTEDGKLNQLYTAGTDETARFVVKYNCKEQGDAFLRDHGYGSAVYASAYALPDTVPIFQIPEKNIETQEDKYFTITKYAPANFNDGSSFKFESYVDDPMDIVPSAMVYYKTGTAQLSKKSDFFLVESVRNVLNSDGESTIRLTGYIYDSEKTYYVSTSYTDMPEVSPGDICIMSRDGIDEIVQLEKVYDLSEDKVTEGYEGTSRGDTVAVRVLHVYNAPEGSEFVETYEGGFENGVPGDENKVLFNFRPSSRTKRDLFTFDIENEKGQLLQPEKIIDYLHDTENYAKIVVRFGDNYQFDAVIYQ